MLNSKRKLNTLANDFMGYLAGNTPKCGMVSPELAGIRKSPTCAHSMTLYFIVAKYVSGLQHWRAEETEYNSKNEFLKFYRFSVFTLISKENELIVRNTNWIPTSSGMSVWLPAKCPCVNLVGWCPAKMSSYVTPLAAPMPSRRPCCSVLLGRRFWTLLLCLQEKVNVIEGELYFWYHKNTNIEIKSSYANIILKQIETFNDLLN